MDQHFLEITVIPFVKAFLSELQSFTKEKAEQEHKSFETSFIEYFDKNDLNKRRLHLLTWDIVEKIQGKQTKLFPQIDNDQATDLLVNLLHDKYKSYNSAYKFQQAFFADEDGENHHRVRENVYLFSTLFHNEAVKNRGVSIKTCSDEQIKHLQKLIKTTLGEARYKQVAPQVFLPKNQVYISNDLAYELESGFKLMVESKFENATDIEVAFDRQTLSLDAVVKLPKQDIQILSTTGTDSAVVVKLASQEKAEDKENQPVVRVKNIQGEEVLLQVAKPNLPKDSRAEQVYLAGQSRFTPREQGRIFDFQGNAPAGSEDEVTHVGPVSGYAKEEHNLPLQPRPDRFMSKKILGNRGRFTLKQYGKLNQAQDYSVQQRATTRFKSRPSVQKAGNEQAQNGNPNQQKDDQQQNRQKTGQQKQVAQGRGTSKKSPIWQLVAASAGVSGVPIGLAGFAGMMSNPQTANPTTNTIASVVNGAHHLLASFIGLFA